MRTRKSGVTPASLIKLAERTDKLYRLNRELYEDRTTADDIKEKLVRFESYRDDPVGFSSDILGDTLTEPQVEIARRILKERIVPVPAAHAVGKSFLASRLLLWAVFARQQLVITTAPTRRQVEEILWSEIRRVLEKHNLPGESGVRFLRVSEWARAYGFTATTAGHASDSAFQGIHSPNGVLILVDEANGIHPNIFDGALACLSGDKDRLLLIGNPTVPDTPFHEACKLYVPTRIPAWSHPNISDKYSLTDDGRHRLKPEYLDKLPDKYPYPGAVTCSWVEDIRESKGEDSPYWLGRVEAIFPETNSASIVPRSWLEGSRNKAYILTANGEKRRWGVDVGDGGDPHAIAAFLGNNLVHLEEIEGVGDGKDISYLVDRVAQLASKDERIAVDVTGVGAGCASQLLTLGYSVERRHFAAKAKDTQAYANWVAEIAWNMREAFRSEAVSSKSVPESSWHDLVRELGATHYVELPSGKLGLEKKEETKKRLKGKSPNLRDCLLLSWGCSRKKVLGLGYGSPPRLTSLMDVDNF
jgi:hypothetical protein